MREKIRLEAVAGTHKPLVGGSIPPATTNLFSTASRFIDKHFIFMRCPHFSLAPETPRLTFYLTIINRDC
jgi:hypothetical protein